MKKYFVFLPLIAPSCNDELGKTTPHNYDNHGKNNKHAAIGVGQKFLSSKYENVSRVLDIVEKNLPSSFKQDNPTYPDQMACLKTLFVDHFDEIQENLSKLLDLLILKHIKIDSPFALVCVLGNEPVLKKFLDFIEPKDIKISMNDKQIRTYSESDLKIIICSSMGRREKCGKILERELLYHHSPCTYVVQSGNVDILRLLIDRSKKVDKDASLNLKVGLDMAAFYGNLAILKLLIQEGGSIDHHMIMHLIYNGYVPVVIELLSQSLIREEKLIKKDGKIGCLLRNVFSSAAGRYINIISSKTCQSTLLSLHLKEEEEKELKSLQHLLKILIDKGIDILEKDPGKSTINLLSVMEFCNKNYIIHDLEFRNLIFTLSEHPHFEKIIDEPYNCYVVDRYNATTIRKVAKQYGLLKTVDLLESIKKPEPRVSNESGMTTRELAERSQLFGKKALIKK